MIVLDLIKFELQIFYMFYIYCIVLPNVKLSQYNDWLWTGDGLGSNPGGDEIFHQSRPALGHTQPPVQWVPGLSWG